MKEISGSGNLGVKKAIIMASAKLLMALTIFFAGPLSHLWWGYEYPGPGMGQLDLIGIVIFISFVCAILFLLLSISSTIFLRRKRQSARRLIDLIVWGVGFAFVIYAGVSARIVAK